MKIWKSYFNESIIMSTDIQRILLYFNLPFNDIIKEEHEPVKVFTRDLTNNNQQS